MGEHESDKQATDLQANKMTEQNKLEQISEKVDQLYKNMHYGHMADYILLMNQPRRLFMKSLLAGIGRGVGIAIGLTVFLVSLLYFLRALGALNLPIIGDYIADIVEIVQNQLQLRNF